VARTNARQGNTNWKNWFPKISSLLTESGTFDCIFPIEQKEEVIELASQQSLFVRKMTTVYPKPNIPAHRVVISFSKSFGPSIFDKLIIETNERHQYTAAYRELLQDYLIIF